jgi:phosphoribosylformimino-5-aminoimidazole carboxamide ribotide isomerase
VILFPAIDIRGGRTVRLEQGDFERETDYGGRPLAAARSFVEDGAEALHVVDLDGARAGEPVAIDHLREIAAALEVPVQYGGGLRSTDAVGAAFAAGAARVVLGTAAYRDEALIAAALDRYGDRVAVAVDVRGGRVAVAGWTEGASASPEEAIQLMQARGVRRFVYTSVERDGMLAGPDLDEVRRVTASVSGRLVYSGGIGALEHLAALRELGLERLEGVISGKALYDGRFTVAEAIDALAPRTPAER